MLSSLLRALKRPRHRGLSSLSVSRGSHIAALDPSKRTEEELMPAFEKCLFYPVNIGDVINAKYQVISKLGFGANSTVWLCRDVIKHRYIALKVYIQTSRVNREVSVLSHLSAIKTKHIGSTLFRNMLDAFEIEGPRGKHQCIIFEPLLTSVSHFQKILDPPSLTEELLKPLLRQIFLVLDYLHSEAGVIHTDIQTKNIMIACRDNTLFDQLEKLEKEEPSPYKINETYTVYRSRAFNNDQGRGRYGLPLLSDFGEARIGEKHMGLIQPTLYRAPEVILGMTWTSKVDIWNVGTLIWDLFEEHHLFDGRGPNGQHSDETLLAEMTAILGSPPVSFLKKSPQTTGFWDESGQWVGQVKVPELSLEDSEEYLDGDNKIKFLNFVRKMLQWDPDCRQSARDLLCDEWLSSP